MQNSSSIYYPVICHNESENGIHYGCGAYQCADSPDSKMRKMYGQGQNYPRQLRRFCKVYPAELPSSDWRYHHVPSPWAQRELGDSQ